MMPDLRASLAVACPVLARVIGSIGERAAIPLGARQDIVPVRRIAASVNDFSLLVDRRLLRKIVRVTVKLVNVLGNDHTIGITPGSTPDAVAGIDRGLIRGEIRTPRAVPGADDRRKGRAVAVGSRQPTQSGSVARPGPMLVTKKLNWSTWDALSANGKREPNTNMSIAVRMDGRSFIWTLLYSILAW